MRNLTIIFLLLSKTIFASFDMNDRMQKTYTHIINLEFDAAKQLISLEQTNNASNGFIQLHENYIDFLTVLIGEDYAYFEKTENQKAIRIDLLEDNDENSPYYLYSQAEIHLQWAFARLKFEDYITAAYEFVKAYYLLEENSELYPDFVLNKKGLGLLYSLLGAVPDQYNWILNLAGLQGSIDLGLSELNIVLDAAETEMYQNEVLFLVSFLQINLTNNNELCQGYLDRIGEKYTNNYLLNFAAARLSYNLGQNDLTLQILENRPSTVNKYPFHYLDYLLGMSYLYKLEYEKSEQYFNRFLDNFKGNNYIKSAYHKLALIADLQYNSEKKIIYFKKAIHEGSASIDEDKVALKDAKQNYITHPILLKGRLLYDGGYYPLALAELQQIENPHYFSNSSNHIEYWYRLARIKAKLNVKYLDVISNYQKAFNLGKETSTYFAPMSALQIGLIYEKQNDTKLAAIYFEKCLTLSNFDYERGIHQKAKAGIERVQN
jgi:hypothetical protein